MQSISMQQSITIKNRIDSIDILRGIVMVIMALDHVRDFFHIHANTDDPLNLITTTPWLFFTRWITHFCAPIFVFLSGVSIYLQSLRKTKKELSAFLIKRGLWLIFAEVAIVTLAISFNPFYNFILLQVIWAIGFSMVILGVLIHLPFKFILTLALVIVLGHNLLDIPESAPGFKAGFWWDLLHHGFFAVYPFAPNHVVAIMYPFVPWLGLMLLGYCTGTFFTSTYSAEQRKKILLRIGMTVILFFIVVRFINVYGDPFSWSLQRNGLYTFLSFIKVHKYPPSLMYMCMTIGPALIFLALIEKVQNGFTNVFRTYGRTAFFYYIMHFYLAHLLCGIAFFMRGHSLQDAINAMQNVPFLFNIPGEGYGLVIVYMIWAFVVISLYPLCKWYDKYKTSHKEKWWLSYL
jgi:uncharacterized membrane protein